MRNLTIHRPAIEGQDILDLREAINFEIKRLGLTDFGVRPISQRPEFLMDALIAGRLVGRELGAPSGQLVGPVRPWLQTLVEHPVMVQERDHNTARRARAHMIARRQRRAVARYPLFPDFSGFNTGVDLAQLRKAGVWVVMLKLTEGTDFVSDVGVQRWRIAGRLGFVRIGYAYARPSRSGPNGHADHLLDVLAAAGGWTDRDRLSIDWEDSNFGGNGDGFVEEMKRRANRHRRYIKDIYSYGPYAASTLSSTHGLRYHHAAYIPRPLSTVPGWARRALGYVQFNDGVHGAGPHWLPGGGYEGGGHRHDTNRILIRPDVLVSG